MNNNNQIKRAIAILEDGQMLPSQFKNILFPNTNKEFSIEYDDKIREADLLADDDGTYAGPLQVDLKIGNNIEDKWSNMIVYGDNLQLLKTIKKNEDLLIKDKVKNKIKLIYIDPPFASKREFKGSNGANAYMDKLDNTLFLEFLRRRLILAREILADDGSIFVHLDSKMGHYVKVLLDEIFGKDKFINQIVWHYKTYIGQAKEFYPRKHDVIFWYIKNRRPEFNLTYKGNYEDMPDFQRWSQYLVDGNKIMGNNYPSKDSRFMAYYKNWVSENKRKPSKNDVLLELKGHVIDDVWDDIQAIDPKDKKEKNGYPTQKPIELLERIISAVTKEDDIVLDFFAGSGTTAEAAEKLKRRWIVCDLGKYSFYTIQKRMMNNFEEGKYNIVTAKLGIYDLAAIQELNREKYNNFVSHLFDIKLDSIEICGYKFEGRKLDAPVKIFNFIENKDVQIDEEYVEKLYAEIKRSAPSEIYIVAPLTCIVIASDSYKIDNTYFYFLGIPYEVVKHIHKLPFKKGIQASSREDINNFEEIKGFHFIRKPRIKYKISVSNSKLSLIIESFISTDKETKELGFEELAMIMIDYNYNDKFFNYGKTLFRGDFESDAKKLKIEESIKNIGSKIFVKIIDIFGNEFNIIEKLNS